MTSCSTRCETNERVLLAAASALILLAWTALFFADVNHPPGVRTARVAGAALAIGIGVLEYVRPWWGFGAFLLFWPQMMVARELLQKVLGPTWGAFPTITAGPLAASLGLGFLLRNWKAGGDPPPANYSERENTSTEIYVKWLRIALWCLAAVWTLSAAIATVRLLKSPPPGWHVDPADWRHASGPSAYSALAPAASALRIVPEFLLGLILFNHLSRKDRRGISVPTDALFNCLAICAGLVVVELAAQLVLHRDWAFDENPPGGPFNNRNTASPVLIIFSLLCLAQAQRKAAGALWNFLAAACLLLACAISSRNGLFMAGMLGVVLLTLHLKRRWIVLAVAAGAIALCLWAPLPRSDSFKSLNVVRAFATLEDLRAGNWDALTSYRSELYSSGARIFAAHPLLGSGPATFPMLTAPAVQGVPPAPFAVSGQGAFYSAHSMPINLAAETGIAGALAWIVIWLLIPAAALFRSKLQNRWMWLAVLMIGVGTLLDTFWLAAGMATFSVVILWMACGEGEEVRS